MDSTLERPRISKATLWTARVIGALAVLFLLFDVFGKLTRPAQVVDAFVREGIPISLAPVIGILLLALIVLYLIPRTSIFGAILMTGYLGGATAVNLRAGDPPFEVIFPIIMGVWIWAPLYLCNERVRAIMPLQR